jgi:hypothetical protein
MTGAADAGKIALNIMAPAVRTATERRFPGVWDMA